MNLIICCTPLQVLIARKIIALYPNESFYGVMFGGVWDKKRTLYANKLAEVCTESININTGKDLKRFDMLNLMRSLKSQIKYKKFDRVFFANLNSLWIQCYLSYVNFQHLYTFDDGSDNIFPHPNLLKEPATLKYQLIKLFIRDKYNVPKLFNQIEKHYTIYPNYKNIVPQIQPIALWDTANVGETNGEVSFFIGQPLCNTKEENMALIKQLKDNLTFDYYFPHPAEDYRVEGVNYVESELIFEDYVFKHLSDKKVIIYTFFSSVAFNLLSDPNVEIRFIKTSIPKWQFCYEAFGDLGLSIYKEI